MPSTTSADATREEKRLAIRKAAYRCFSENGYHCTAVRDVCKAAGISKGTFYWYFDSKQAVFVEIIDGWANEVEGEMQSQFTTAMASENAWGTITRAVEREALRSRSVVPLWLDFLAEAARHDYARIALARFHNRLLDVLTELLKIALTDSASPEEPRALASSALAMFFGLLCQELADPEQASFSAHARTFMTVMQRVTVSPTESDSKQDGPHDA
ncbi:MAG: AcrR family transcriptional regulator [Myxococcota bacterium]|jgi:AcrR family transcriptional regulator